MHKLHPLPVGMEPFLGFDVVDFEQLEIFYYRQKQSIPLRPHVGEVALVCGRVVLLCQI